MPQLKVGIHLPSLRVPLRQAISLAGKFGADAVEIDARSQLKPGELTQTGLRQFRKMLDDNRLRVCAIAFPTRRGYNDLDQLDARVAGTKEAMQMAGALGASVVVNHVGFIPPEPSGPDWDLLVQVLTDLGRHAQRVGAFLTAQTGTVGGEALSKLIAALPDGSIGVDLDPGLLIVNGHDVQAAVDSLAPHIMHVHATDGARDSARGRGLEVPLGRGSVDYPALLGALEERGYRGAFTVRRDSSPDPEVEIGRAVQFLRSL
jgi:sugar phosphate isomerase/epimerase